MTQEKFIIVGPSLDDALRWTKNKALANPDFFKDCGPLYIGSIEQLNMHKYSIRNKPRGVFLPGYENIPSILEIIYDMMVMCDDTNDTLRIIYDKLHEQKIGKITKEPPKFTGQGQKYVRGDTRFNSDGSVGIYDGTNWMRVKDNSVSYD